MAAFDFDPPKIENLKDLLEILRQLAQKYGIDFDEGTDPAAVFQELQRRAGSSETHDIFAELKEYIQSIPRRSRSLTEEVRYNADRYRIWAVLIGIDAYEQYPLHGCVSDALSMKRFLTDDLGVPEHRIQCLLGPRDTNSTDPKSTYSRDIANTFYSLLSKALKSAVIKSTLSRANIVDTLYSLANNSKIRRGDNIIIYYAGHGSRHSCTTHDSKSRCDISCPIEALCPIDRDTRDKHGKLIPDISDRELNFLFKSICRAKGKNITFIADCCHSGGMSRAPQQGIRSVNSSRTSLEDMLRTADERWKSVPGYQSVLSKDWRPDMDSHVILAACQSDQTAHEAEGNNGVNGVFSKELIRVLRSTDCKEEMTYDGLFRLLKIPAGRHQEPVIDGTQRFKPILSRNPPRFWAVLIGIDAYEQQPLRGCVSDALSMKHFLTKDLGVPEHRIQCLLGPKDPNSTDPKSTPSRTNIIDTLYSLADNPEIERDDNIIIYYAGHASTYWCTGHGLKSQCDDSCCIEVLCPIDRGIQDGDEPDISDRELNFLFALIGRAKCHNITFIVDSLYSGRLGRSQLPRYTRIKPPSGANSMLHAANERWKGFPGYRSVFSNNWQPDTDSHITLAAGLSREVHKVDGSYCGMFTDALLHVLKSTDWKEEMTYVDLINRMSGLLQQAPFVSGKRMKEPLWN